jgi:tellurium resistance protein TerD
MGIRLEKGGNINLAKEADLAKVRVALGWDVKATDTGKDFDLDASVFLLKHVVTAAGGVTPRLISDEHFIFYNNLKSPDGSVVHSGDNRTGDAAVDDEVVTVDLLGVEANCSEMSFVVTIHDAEVRKQNFGQVNNAYIRVVDDATDREVARYDLTEDFSTETAIQFGSLYRKDGGDWKFKAIGAGYRHGLDKFVQEYGGNLG